jgi:hypothetical protein
MARAMDIVEKVIRFHNKPGKRSAATLLIECKAEIENLRVELAKEMRETFWLRKEVERLHALLKEARSEF